MKFKTVAEAFNHYRSMTVVQMESRAAEIGKEIDTNADADIEALNIELRGIKEAKANLEMRSAQQPQNLNIITGTEPKAKELGDDILATAEYRSAFFKSMLGQTLSPVEKEAYQRGLTEAEKRADAFNTSTTASAVLPTTTLNEIVSKARTMGGLIAEVRHFNIPTKISVPVGTPASKAAWHTEGVAVESEKNTVASVSFDGYEILKVFSISAKAKKMSVSAFEQYMITELTNCVMECIADSLVNGTGTAQGTGLNTITWTENTNLLTVAKTGSLTYANIVKVVAMLKRGYSKGAKWAMNNATLYNAVYSLVDTTGRPIFISDPKSENIGKILGFEVVIDDNIADNDIYFGNFQYMGYNLPEGIMVEVSRESSFKSGLIDYRALAVADCKPIVPEAFVKITKATA